MKRRINWRLGILIFVLLSGVGGGTWFLWYKRAPAVDHQTIAFIMTSAPSLSSFMRTVRDMIDLFAVNHKIPVKRYISDGTSASVLRLLQQIYADGIRKVIGPSTSHELDETVQRFVADHPDMIMVVVSVTAPKIGAQIKMPNFYRFITADDFLITVYGQLLPMRVGKLTQILLLARDDVWGRSLVELAQRRLAKALPRVAIQPFFYTTPEHFIDKDKFVQHLSESVQKMRALLQKSNEHTAVIEFTFDEITDYVRLVYKDPLFKIPHFGSDMIAYSGILPEDPLVAKFLSEVKFEAVAFFADNAYSTKRLTIARAIFDRQKNSGLPIMIPSQYAFAAYDAMRCLSLCKTGMDIRDIMADFYGATGCIEVDERGNRNAGTFMGIGLVGNGEKYRWAPLTVIRREIVFSQYESTEWIMTDVSPSYRITWDKGLDVRIGAIALDLTDITEPFKPTENQFRAMNAEYIILHYTLKGVTRKFLVFPALQRDGIQVYMDLDTKDLWTMKAFEDLHIDANSDHPLVANNYAVPINAT